MTWLYIILSFLASLAFFFASSLNLLVLVGAALTFASIYVLVKILSNNQRLYYKGLNQGQIELAGNQRSILDSVGDVKKELGNE